MAKIIIVAIFFGDLFPFLRYPRKFTYDVFLSAYHYLSLLIITYHYLSLLIITYH